MFVPRHRSFTWLAAAAALALWSTGCGDDGGGSGSDGGGTDAATDTGTPDTGTPDGGTEAGTDAATDGGTEGGTMRMADLSCTTVGGPPPMVADPTTVTGGVFSSPGIGDSSPLAGATVKAMAPRDETATEAASATSGADGTYSIEIPTAGNPWMGYLRAEATDHVPTNLFWATPFFMTTHENVNIVQLTTTAWGTLQTLLSQETGKGAIVALVVDCAGDPVEGASVEAGDLTPLYSSASGLPTAGSATAADGRATFINATPGALTVTATYEGVTFRPQNVYVIADELTTVVLSPHGAEAMGGGMGGSGGGMGSGGGSST